jgi:hypothetical protein
VEEADQRGQQSHMDGKSGGEAIRPSRKVGKSGGDTDEATQTSMDALRVD